MKNKMFFMLALGFFAIMPSTVFAKDVEVKWQDLGQAERNRILSDWKQLPEEKRVPWVEFRDDYVKNMPSAQKKNFEEKAAKRVAREKEQEKKIEAMRVEQEKQAKIDAEKAKDEAEKQAKIDAKKVEEEAEKQAEKQAKIDAERAKEEAEKTEDIAKEKPAEVSTENQEVTPPPATTADDKGEKKLDKVKNFVKDLF